jgi:DNA-3-methyladenine glycosylase I
MSRAPRLHPDGLKRCPWPGEDPLYVAYHDTEWGVPEYDSRALWEKLILDGFQAGLSWITIPRKRDAFRAGFAGFEPEQVARFTGADVQRLLADPAAVRSPRHDTTRHGQRHACAYWPVRTESYPAGHG